MLFGHAIEFGLGGDTIGHRLGPNSLDVQAAAIVGNLDDDVTAFVIGLQHDGAGFVLAGLAPVVRLLDPVVGRIADHVGQRILDQFQNLAIEFGFGALHHQFDLLVHFDRKVADDARQLRPGIADGLHARFHHPFLKVRGDVAESLQRHLEFAVFLAANHLQKLVAGQHQLADQGHQGFKHIDANADRSVGGGRFLDFPRLFRLGGSLRLRCRNLGGRGRGLGGGRRRGFRFLGSLGFHRRGEFRIAGGALARGLRGHDFVKKLPGDREPTIIQRRAAGGGGHRSCGGRDGFCLGGSVGGGDRPAFGHGVEFSDNRRVFAFGLGTARLEFAQKIANAINAFENHRDRFGRYLQHTVAKFPEHVLARVRDFFQARQTEKTAGALDGVHQTKDIAENPIVARVLLELDQFDVEDREIFRRLGQKFIQQVIHSRTLL